MAPYKENIRDTKSPNFGFGLNDSNSRSPKRVSVLLLIAAIATFVCWLAGILTNQLGEASRFQAASAKFTSVLSLVFLGKEAIKKGRHNRKAILSIIKISAFSGAISF